MAKQKYEPLTPQAKLELLAKFGGLIRIRNKRIREVKAITQKLDVINARLDADENREVKDA